METTDYIFIGIIGLLIMLWKGGISWQGVVAKVKEILAKSEKDDAPKVNLPVVPDVITPAPIDSNTSFSFAELYNRFKDGIQTSDWIWLLRNAVPLVIWLLPLILEKGKAETMTQTKESD